MLLEYRHQTTLFDNSTEYSESRFYFDKIKFNREIMFTPIRISGIRFPLQIH